MRSKEAQLLFSAMGSEYRLAIFKMLVQAGSAGLIPTAINQELKIQDNKLSFHLNHLKKINLITVKRSGRNLIYYANFDKINNLINYLFDRCCEKSDDGKCMPDLVCK